MNDRQNVAVPVSQVVERFNQTAHANGWPVLCDPYCRFIDPKLNDAAQLWREKAQSGIPYRHDMTVRLLQPFVSQLSIYERQRLPDGATRWKARLMGTDVALAMAEMSGKYIDEVLKPEFLPRWKLTGETLLEHGGPLRFLRRVDSFGKRYMVGEDFAAPLLNDRGQMEISMSVSSFDIFDPWEIVEQKTRIELGLN
jgi:hypothetical protein